MALEWDSEPREPGAGSARSAALPALSAMPPDRAPAPAYARSPARSPARTV